MLHRLRSHPLKRRLLGLVLSALLLAQGLMLAHAVAHGSGLAVGVAQSSAVSADSVGSADFATERNPVWGHAAGSAVCLLLDQLLAGQATGFDAAVVARPQADAPPAPGLPPAAVARLALPAYEARGPPRA